MSRARRRLTQTRLEERNFIIGPSSHRAFANPAGAIVAPAVRAMVFRSLIVVLFLACFAPARAEIWRTGYFPGWEQDAMPASALDFTAITHIIHFAATPMADGTLSTNANGLTLAKSTDVVSRTHTAGRKALICIGGGGSQAGFQGAASPAN